MIQAIKNAYILTMNKGFSTYPSGTIVFDQTQILAVGDATTPIPPTAQIIDGQRRLAIMPGFIDVHSHSSLLRGFSENKQLMDWLPEYQREHQVLNEEDAYYACLLSYLEALKGGTTCVMDMYRFLHRGAEAAEQLGMRVHLVPYAADHKDKTFFETLKSTQKLIEKHHNTQNGRIQTWIGLEHITYCSPDMMREARRMSDSYGVNIHTHTSEQQEEVAAVQQIFGKRPVHMFADYGILKPGTVLAHCVWLEDDEIKVLAETQTGIAHCPVSNAKLACGTAPLDKFKKYGLKVGLGSDGSISNNSLSMFECMKFGSLLQKNKHFNAAALSAPEVLRMATIGGAELIGIDHQVGSLEIGKQADLITIDLWKPHLMPIDPTSDHDPIPWNIVYAGRASDIQDVWIQGRQVVAQGKSTLLNEDEALKNIQRQTIDLLRRRKNTSPIPMV